MSLKILPTLSEIQEQAIAYSIGLVDDVVLNMEPVLKNYVERLIAMGYLKGYMDRISREIEEGR